jgi:hypothetical protein
MKTLITTILLLLTPLAPQAQTAIFANAAVYSSNDGGGDNGWIVSQKATLSQGGVIQSITAYLSVASGNIILGLYDTSGAGGGPDHGAYSSCAC